jgi:hypothetical protein
VVISIEATTTGVCGPGDKKTLGQVLGARRSRNVEAFRLTSPEVARFSGTDSPSDDESSAWTSRTYNLFPKIMAVAKIWEVM